MIHVTEGRARRVISRAMTRSKGRFPSFKSGRVVHWESQLERDFVTLLEFDAEILSYREQPLWIEFAKGGSHRRYTPDFLAETKAGQIVFEVKPQRQLAKPGLQSLLAEVGAVLAGKGMRFAVVTEAEIRRRPLLDNIRLALRYQRLEVDPRLADAICRAARDPVALKSLLAGSRGRFGVETVLALICAHRLEADFETTPFGPESLIRAREALR